MGVFFFFAKPLLEKIAARSLFQSSPFLSRTGCSCDLRLQARATTPASYEETHGMLGLLHVRLLLVYSCIKCSTLVLLGLVSHPAFFNSSRNLPPQSKTAA